MPLHNEDIAAVFDEVADLLEIEGDNPFRIRAYRNGARTLRELGRDIRTLVDQGLIKPKPEAQFVMQHAEYGFTTNLPLEIMLSKNLYLEIFSAASQKVEKRIDAITNRLKKFYKH